MTSKHLRRQHPDIYADDIQAYTQTTFSTEVAAHDDRGLATNTAASEASSKVCYNKLQTTFTTAASGMRLYQHFSRSTMM